MKKMVISVLIVFLLVLSLFTAAQADVEEKSTCSSFWGSISCFLWGNPENRAGRGWFERGNNVVGEVPAAPAPAPATPSADALASPAAPAPTPPRNPTQDNPGQFVYNNYEQGISLPVTQSYQRTYALAEVTIYLNSKNEPIGYRDNEGSYLIKSDSILSDNVKNILANLELAKKDYKEQLEVETNAYLDALASTIPPQITPSPTPSPPTPPPQNAPPSGSQKIEGTDYFLTPEGNFVDAQGKPAPKMDILLNPARPIITHDQAYAMLDARAQQSESRVLAGLPDGTQVNYQGNTYQYSGGKWQTSDNKPAPAGLSAAVVQGEAQVTQTNLLGGLPESDFILNDQLYSYRSDGNWHQITDDNKNPVISAADLQKLLLDSKATVTENDILAERITALKTQKDQINAAKKARQEADSQMWAGSWFEGIQTSQGYQNIKQYASTAGDIASVMKSGGKYQALSNALFGRETSRTWILNADNEFLTTWANLPSFAATHGPLAPEACKLDDARRTEIPGSSSQFVQTAGGSYQFVGAIQAEKTATTQPILCKRNEDPEIESEFVCRTKQVCVDDTFCHADANEDREPDSDEPEKGYFYKITWGVTAPQDESFTPYIDEDSKAVKFNIQLMAEDGTSIWLYNRAGVAGTSVIALENGASDRDVKTHFSPKRYLKVCIRYDPQHLIKDRDGTPVEDQCVDIIVRNSGSVEFGASQRTQSVTTTSAEVSSNADW